MSRAQLTHFSTVIITTVWVIITMLGQCAWMADVGHAQGDWFDSELLLDTLRDGLDNTNLPYRTSGNRDCMKRKLVTRPKNILLLQTEITKDACVTESDIGLVDEQSYLQKSNTRVAGKVKDYYGADAAVIAVPGTADIVLLDKSAPSNTVFLRMYHDAYYDLKTIQKTTGHIEHRFTTLPDGVLQNASGSPIGVRATTLSFSRNANYMVADVPGVGLARVDRNSLNVQPFARLPITSADWQTAVSDSGRYALVASYVDQIFRLYDVEACTKQVLNMYEQCRYVDLNQFMNARVQSYAGVSRLKFVNDQSIDFYGARFVSGARVQAHYSIRIEGSASGSGYMALGDSFSSGEGAYNYRDGTDSSTNRCHVSAESYPFLVGATAGLGDYHSVACSGAKLKDLVSANEDKYDKYDAQSKGLSDRASSDEIYSSFLPGYRLQRNFIRRSMPSVVTLTAGGNDIGFGDIVQRCASYDTCYQYREEREQLLNSIDAQYDRLVQLYDDLSNEAGRDRVRIYVLGYPMLVDPGGNCAANVHLNQGELYFANELVMYLNHVIQAAAQRAGVVYVDVSEALVGARLCEADSSGLAVNGLTLGNGAPSVTGPLGPLASESYHPNSYGHQLLAQALVAKTQSLTIPMPLPDTNTVFSPNHSQLSIIQNAQQKLQSLYNGHEQDTLVYHDGGDEVFYQGSDAAIDVFTVTEGLAPSAEYTVELHSDPTPIGSFTTDDHGEASPILYIPDDAPLGIHTLHVYGKDVTGQDVDLFRTVYVRDGSQDNCDAVTTMFGTSQDSAQESCSGGGGPTEGNSGDVAHDTAYGHASAGDKSLTTNDKLGDRGVNVETFSKSAHGSFLSSYGIAPMLLGREGFAASEKLVRLLLSSQQRTRIHIWILSAALSGLVTLSASVWVIRRRRMGARC